MLTRRTWGNTPYLVPLSSVVTRYQPLSPVVICYTLSSPVTTRCHPSSPVVFRRHLLSPLNIFSHFRHDLLSSGSFASFERPPASISYRPPYCLLGARGVTRHIWSHCHPLSPAINLCHLLSSVIPCRHPLLPVVTRRLPLYFVVICCHLLSSVTTRCRFILIYRPPYCLLGTPNL